MRNGTTRYTVETLRAGQPGPYADTIHEFVLTVEWIPYGYTKANPKGAADRQFEPCDIDDSRAKDLGNKIGGGFYEKGDPEANWASPRLTTFCKIGPGQWRFVVTSAFTD